MIGAGVVYHCLRRKKELRRQPNQNTYTEASIAPVAAPIESAPAVNEPQKNPYDGDPVFSLII